MKIEGDITDIFGQLDENVGAIEKACGVHISLSPNGLELRGEDEAVRLSEEVVRVLIKLMSVGEEIDRAVVNRAVELVKGGNASKIEEIYGTVIATTARGKKIRVKSRGQLDYYKAIKNTTLVIGIGPAGSGKTFIAVAAAVNALRAGEVQKIILTRPALEAGEKLGFLPGDLQMKVDPYLRPLYDALEELMGESYLRLVERGVLEIAPLAYMRGRTLKSAFIILDEAQNTTCEQMKMFLTRLGEGSKMVVEGDVSQIDLPQGKYSGLLDAANVLSDIDRVAIVRLGKADVVRHELVQKIVQAYDNRSKGENRKDEA